MPLSRRGYSKVLNLPYKFDPDSGEIAFSSGVSYNLKETLQISTFTDIDVKAIHMVKEAFDIPQKVPAKRVQYLRAYTGKIGELKGEQIDLFAEPTPMEKLREKIQSIST
jgi:hypothetical protein